MRIEATGKTPINKTTTTRYMTHPHAGLGAHHLLGIDMLNQALEGVIPGLG
jgi:hypothetical protein